MAGLDITIRPAEGDTAAAVAEVSGVIDGTTVARFQEAIEDVRRKGTRRLVLDMARVRYVNSTGLGELVKYADKFEGAGGGLALTKVTAKVKIVIEMLGLHQKLEICGDERQALDALSRQKTQAISRESVMASGPPRPEAPPLPSRPPPLKPPLPPPLPARPPADASAARSGHGVADAGGATTAHLPGFPAAIPCGSCAVTVEVVEPGNWKCPRCGTVLTVKSDGSVRFLAPERPGPAELSINCTRECAEGLKAFVGALAQPLWNGGAELERVKTAVGEVAQVIANTVYAFDTKAIFHVQVETTPGELRIKIADHGRPIDSSRVESYFPTATRTFTELDCRQHPKGGNIIRMVKRK